jgi:hypothetical protein
VVGIETDRGPWVQALIAAGYTVYPMAESDRHCNTSSVMSSMGLA